MSGGFDFAQPWALLLLPLALLPLLRSRRETLTFSFVPLLPEDALGRVLGWMWPLIGMCALASSILALAQPGRAETQVQRSGQGAEILVLLDRSRSMDDRMLPSDWRQLDPAVLLYHKDRGPQKSATARDLLSRFVAQRADDRFSLMYFSTRPMSVVPFTQHDDVVEAGIEAGATGRGLSETDVGRALLAAIGEFDDRAYTGSRIILLVSDGGAHLNEETADRIRRGLFRNRIGLYWIYLRSYNSPELDSTQTRWDNAPEMALHRFFQSLQTPYRAYQAEAPEDLAKAVRDVGRQQNLPLDFTETVPRQDDSRYFIAIAALCCVLLLAYRSVLLRSWS